MKEKYHCSGGGHISTVVPMPTPTLTSRGSENKVLVREKISKSDAIDAIRVIWPNELSTQFNDVKEEMLLNLSGEVFEKILTFKNGIGSFS